jgi:hypothetical protein
MPANNKLLRVFWWWRPLAWSDPDLHRPRKCLASDSSTGSEVSPPPDRDGRDLIEACAPVEGSSQWCPPRLGSGERDSDVHLSTEGRKT